MVVSSSDESITACTACGKRPRHKLRDERNTLYCCGAGVTAIFYSEAVTMWNKKMTNEPFRVPAQVEHLTEEVTEHKGPRATCPFCRKSTSDHWKTYACFGSSWLGRLFGGCARQTPHIHQKCSTCNGTWVCAPAETL